MLRGVSSAVLVEVFSCETGDRGREGELANAEEEGDEICCDHFGGCWLTLLGLKLKLELR